MKKLMNWVIIMSLGAALLFGCGKEPEEVMQPVISEEESESIVVDTEKSTEGYLLVLGILVEKDSGYVSIKTHDNYDLTFKLAPETVIYTGEAAELVPGEEIAVVFDGELDGLDTGGVQVITVSIIEKEEDGDAEEEEEQPQMPVTVSENGYNQVTGAVTDATMNTITVTADNGAEVVFFPNDDTIKDLVDGLIIDDVVTVTFEGDLQGNDSTEVTVLQIMELE